MSSSAGPGRRANVLKVNRQEQKSRDRKSISGVSSVSNVIRSRASVLQIITASPHHLAHWLPKVPFGWMRPGFTTELRLALSSQSVSPSLWYSFMSFRNHRVRVGLWWSPLQTKTDTKCEFQRNRFFISRQVSCSSSWNRGWPRTPDPPLLAPSEC